MSDFEDFIVDAREEFELACEVRAPGTESIYERLDAESSQPGLLAEFVAAAIEEQDEAVSDARAPELPATVTQEASAKGRGAWWVGALAAAALLVLFGSRLANLADSNEQAQPHEQAAMQADSDAGASSGLGTPVETPRMEAVREVPKTEMEPEPAPVEAVEVVESEPRVEPRAKRPRPKTSAPEVEAESLDQRLQRLDRLAQSAWRAGDREGARKHFETIVRIGGRHSRVQLAYGDLFTLARQSVGDERGLWMAYLERFPRGRYADDARAGLCKRARGDASECWRDYLDDFPKGTHAATARSALEASGD